MTGELGAFSPAAGGSAPSAAGVFAPLRRQILDHIVDTERNKSRSMQAAIGPSQVGVSCPRSLAFMARSVERGGTRSSDRSDPWPSIVGTAVHDWCDTAFARHPEYLTNLRVHAGEGLSGRLDLFHVPSGTVVDLKIPGESSYRDYAAHPADDPWWWHGLGSQYRVQIQTYGKGAANAGHVVKRVALMVICKSKRLSSAVMIGWDYDPAVSEEALGRLRAARTLAAAGVDPRVVPARPDSKTCYFCEYRGDDAAGLCDEGVR